MPEKIKINWSVNVQIAEGPKLSEAKTLTVDAYDKIEITLKKKDPTASTITPVQVQVQPGDSGKVKFLMITSDVYEDTLTYKVNNSETATPEIILDAMQLFMEGAVGLLSKDAPTRLFFSNGTGKDISIQILVGRKAIAS